MPGDAAQDTSEGLVVRLVHCRTLHQQIEGVRQGIMGGLPVDGA